VKYTGSIDDFALPVLNGHNLHKQRCLVEISISNRTLSNLLSTRAQLVMACGPAAGSCMRFVTMAAHIIEVHILTIGGIDDSLAGHHYTLSI
jgi:hypothetical protein